MKKYSKAKIAMMAIILICLALNIAQCNNNSSNNKVIVSQKQTIDSSFNVITAKDFLIEKQANRLHSDSIVIASHCAGEKEIEKRTTEIINIINALKK